MASTAHDSTRHDGGIIACPTCRCGNPIVCGSRLFLTAECPICLERKSPLVALPCGHCMCIDDFVRMGHTMPSALALPRAVLLPEPPRLHAPSPELQPSSPDSPPPRIPSPPATSESPGTPSPPLDAGTSPSPPPALQGSERPGSLRGRFAAFVSMLGTGRRRRQLPDALSGSPQHSSLLRSRGVSHSVSVSFIGSRHGGGSPSGGAVGSPMSTVEAVAEWTRGRQERDAVVRMIRTHGRSYQSGEVLITFGELRDFAELQQMDLPAVLLAARAEKLISYSDDERGHTAAGEAAGEAEDEAPLTPEEDDEVVITTLQLQATRSNSEYKAWRKGSYVPHRGAAPIVDIDEGELTYVLVEAVSPAGDVVTLVRGFVKEEYPSHADVLDTAQEPLAHAGYTAIRCVGGGTLWHTKWSKTMFISGASRFGPANHRVTERLLREHWIGGYRIAILDEGALAEPVGSAIAQVADLSTYA